MSSLEDEPVRDLVQRYVLAWEKRDVDALVALLVEDAIFAMPPYPNWWRGRDAVVEFIAGTGTPDLRHQTTQANGQPAVGWYVWEPDRNAYAPAALEVLDIEGTRVKQITAFAFPRLFARFGLPTELRRAPYLSADSGAWVRTCGRLRDHRACLRSPEHSDPASSTGYPTSLAA
ncbi:MAG TPA: nuclear transport factor 2 family protein [Solirubrobacterales bacterium]|nr:nuclear transport factor 2 family protein [Solirubrobacterales bacterium]